MKGVVLFFAFLLLCVVRQAALADDYTCSPPDLKVTQTITGLTISGKQEFKVTLNNDCVCVQSNVKVSCDGFHTSEPVDPLIIRPLGDGSSACLVNNGAPIYNGPPVEFKYAWDVSPSFSIVSSDISCS